MKHLIFTLSLICIASIVTSCKSKPEPGQPGNRQLYRPLMHHITKNQPEELQGLRKLKKSDPEKYRTQLSILKRKHASSIKRVRDKSGNFTCGCPECIDR